jgi:catechol 2,3-dioxygenase-like lactoylglutathione lyase family enzyme
MTDSGIEVQGLDHFVLRVRDLDASLRFYRDLLGLKIEFLDEYRAGTRPFVSARVGGQLVDLLPDPTYDPATGGNASGFLHLCVRIARPSMAELVPLLKQRGVDMVDDQPLPRMGATGMGLSLYVRDPDQYMVELKEHR